MFFSANSKKGRERNNTYYGNTNPVRASTEELFSLKRKFLWQFSLSFFPKFRMQTSLVIPTIKEVIPCCL